MGAVSHRRKWRVLWFHPDHGHEVRCKNLDSGNLAVSIPAQPSGFHGIAGRQRPDLHKGSRLVVGYVDHGDAPVLAGWAQRDRCRPFACPLGGTPAVRRARHFDQAACLLWRDRTRIRRHAAETQ